MKCPNCNEPMELRLMEHSTQDEVWVCPVCPFVCFAAWDKSNVQALVDVLEIGWDQVGKRGMVTRAWWKRDRAWSEYTKLSKESRDANDTATKLYLAVSEAFDKWQEACNEIEEAVKQKVHDGM